MTSNIPTQIAVRQLGTNTNEVRFVVKTLSGTIIYQKKTAATFGDDAIFTGFCPATGCPNNLELTITMTDAFGDGWNSNILAIKQGDTVVGTFGTGFTSGTTTAPVKFVV